MWDITFCANEECTRTDCKRHITKAREVPEWHPVSMAHFGTGGEYSCKEYERK